MSDFISGHAKHHRKVMPDAKMQRDPGIGLPSRGGAPQDECGQRSAHTFRGQYGRAAERDQQVRLEGWVAPGAPVTSGGGRHLQTGVLGVECGPRMWAGHSPVAG